MLPVDLDSNPQLLGSAQVWTEHVPKDLRRKLHVFAGQLYTDSFNDYLSWKEIIDPEAKSSMNGPSLAFWREWFGMRRRGQDFLQSHVGQIIKGRLLMPESFE